MRVFISHSSHDKPQVEALAVALRERGFDTWLEKWELQTGDNLATRLSPEVVHGRELFLRGFRSGARRDPAAAERANREQDLVELGQALRPLCLPGDAATALADLLDGSPLGTTVEVRFESADTELLGLPFEALRLPDDQLLVVHPKVVMLRRPLGLVPAKAGQLAGPLKILVAVGAPDEDRTPNVVLDHERELQNILDAVEEARSRENVEVRILEVGSLPRRSVRRSSATPTMCSASPATARPACWNWRPRTAPPCGFRLRSCWSRSNPRAVPYRWSF